MNTRLYAILNDIKNVLKILNKRQKYLGLIVLVLAIVNAGIQTVGVAIIVPIVSAMTSPEDFMGKSWVKEIAGFLGYNNSIDIFVLMCIITIVLYIIKELFSIFESYISVRYSNKVQREVSTLILNGYMGKNYDFFLNYGTAQIIRDVVNDTGGLYNVLSDSFKIITEGLTVFFILTYICVMDWMIALVILGLSIVSLAVINIFFKRRMDQAGALARIAQAENNKVLLEAIEGIKEVQVMKKQDFFAKRYVETYIEKQKPTIVQTVGITAPTYILEGFFVSGIFLYIVSRVIYDSNYFSQLPLLASFLVGAVRILPSIGRITANINDLSFWHLSVESVYKNVCEFERDNVDINFYSGENDTLSSFNDKLELTKIDWCYTDDTKYVLRNLSLTVNKGESIGIIGSSGVGKSTLGDIILGLHIPQDGSVLIDGIDINKIPISYSKIIGYVPQTIYLVDGDIKENVAFGVERKDIDIQQVWRALEQAQLADFVRSQSMGLETLVGERGVKFSGGQRQRLAIARALYRSPQILILDEATSALDNETESAVMESIESLYGKMTMIIIAHRLTTVMKCDNIYEIKDGKAFKREKEKIFNDALK